MMARTTKPLTDTEIKQAKPKTKEYTLSDGGGLLLRIKPNDSKTWFFNYVHPYTNKRNKISLGAYPIVSLANARKQREEAKTLLIEGIDPKSHRQKQRQAKTAEHAMTLSNVYQKWLNVWRQDKDEATVKKAIRHMQLYALPTLGNYPIKEITAPLAIETLKPLEKQGKLETLVRVRTKLNQVMTFAVHTGVIEHNPLTKISAAFASRPATHQPAIHPKKLPELLQSITTAITPNEIISCATFQHIITV